jgi:NADPH-dependent curcumin reductase CurA
LSVLGTTGLTAYVGVLDIAEPEPGETVVVSGAAGAVGSVAGQIARIKGCRVVGIAGGPEKCRWVTEELGFDACIDYKSENVPQRLKETCPEGIDIYFDNVGGEILNDVLAQINNFARIVLCGAISGYDSADTRPGPANLSNAIVRRATLRGFIVLDHFDRAKEASTVLAGWLADGSLQSRVTITEGFEGVPTALKGLFTGENMGKALVRL